MVSIELARKHKQLSLEELASGKKPTPWNKFLEAEQKVCNHEYQPKFYSHNDSFAGMVCDKCGKRG